MPKFPTQAELSTMSLSRLRLVDISNKEEELAVQRAVDAIVADSPGSGDIYRGDVPDIKTPEEEARWQKIIDERVERSKPRQVLSKDDDDEEETPADEDEEELPVDATPLETTGEEVDYVLKMEDIERNPTLEQQGYQAGDTIKLPKEVVDEVTPKRFCEQCDSKGRFHKKDCPTKAQGDN